MTTPSETPSARAIAACLGVAVLSAVLFQGHGHNLYMLVPAATALMAAVGLALYGASRNGAIRLPWGPPALLAAGYGLWLLLGPLWSTWPEISRIHFWILGAFPIGFLVAATVPDDDRIWRRLWPPLGLLAAGLGLWGVVELAWRGERTLGPTLDFNGYAALLNLFFFPAFAVALGADDPRRRYLGLALAALLGAAVWTTFSRAGIGLWLLLGATLAVFGLRTFAARAWPAIVVVGLCVAATGLWINLAAGSAAPARPIIDLSEDASTLNRLRMWQSAWEIYRRHPLLGTGTGTFKLHYLGGRDPAEPGPGNYAHNDYLQALQEGGPVQLLMLIALALTTALLWLRLALALWRRRAGAAGRWPAFALLTSVGALFLHANVNFIFYLMGPSLLGGLFLGRAWRLCGGRHRYIPLRLAAPLRAALCSLPALWPPATLTPDAAIAAIYARQSDWQPLAALRDSPRRGYAAAQTLAALSPDNITVRLYAATIEQALAEASATEEARRLWAERALRSHLELIAMRPINPLVYRYLADLMERFPELVSSQLPAHLPRDRVGLYLLAVRQNPAEAAHYLPLIRLLRSRGEAEAAYQLVTRQGLRWLNVRAPHAQADRRRLLREAVALARALGRDDEAAALSAALAAYAGEHPDSP